MKRGRLPLTALRSFEVAARLRSFTRAADELLISQSAVSRQVRELERQLGQPLFERRHRMVVLTAAGEALLAVLTRTFDEIGTSLDKIRAEQPSQTLAISVEPSFATGWLVPHLSAFRQLQPEIDILFDADPRPIEFRTDQAVLAIRHSVNRTAWPRVESRHIADVTMIPVAAPHLLDRHGTLKGPADLMPFPLLHEDDRDLWQHWFAAAGIVTEKPRGFVYPDGGLVLQAAVRGEGIALLDQMFAKDELAAGRLVQPFELSIPHGAYWLVAKRFSDLPGPAETFANWLQTALNATESTENHRSMRPRA